MKSPVFLDDLKGEWTGESRLWLSPGEPARLSETTAWIAPVAQGRFVMMRYTWAEERRPQDGLIVIGVRAPGAAVEAFWVDSGHMGDKFMACRGAVGQDGVVSVQGTYAAPPGPDWGWRIVVILEAPSAFRIKMYNLSPDGEEALAVEAAYTRRS